jgi:hypothetical protein
MRVLLLLIVFLFTISGKAQHNPVGHSTKNTSHTFPKSFVGVWKGTMHWYPNNGKAPVTNVAVEIHIKPIKDSINQYTWKIIYGSKKEDVRPYVLRKVDTVANHWVIDELDGLVLDCYWLGNHLSGAFAVDGNTILDSYWLDNGDLHFEFFGYPKQPMKTVKQNEDKATAENPPVTVDLYKITSYQKGVLKKVKTK